MTEIVNAVVFFTHISTSYFKILLFKHHEANTRYAFRVSTNIETDGQIYWGFHMYLDGIKGKPRYISSTYTEKEISMRGPKSLAISILVHFFLFYLARLLHIDQVHSKLKFSHVPKFKKKTS